MMSKDKRIVILGAGALGLYYGARLVEAGWNVTFVVRSDYEGLAANGLHLHSVHGDLHLPQVQVVRDPYALGVADLVFVTWKTTANAALAGTLPPIVGSETIVVTLQNGMGNAEAIAQFVPAERVMVGMCFICAMRTDKAGEINHLEGGAIQFAPMVDSPAGLALAEELACMFNQARVKAKALELSEYIQWTKLVWNVPFNGLCLAQGGISVEDLYKDVTLVDRAYHLMLEVVAAAKTRGYVLDDKLVEFHLERTGKMGAFVPSSAVDYNEGRPVEYESIWAYPLGLARAAGAVIPYWEQLDKEIRTRLRI